MTGVGGEGVTTANLGSAAAVSAAFNAEFAITAANGEDALLVINDTNGNSFSLWQWVQAGGGETSAAELTLIGTFSGQRRGGGSQLRLRLIGNARDGAGRASALLRILEETRT